MLELEAALERMLAGLPAAEPERIELGRAHRRILAERILSPLDLPGFDNSAMDGYAVRAAEVTAAPVVLKLMGRVAAGEVFSGEVAAGSCVRIFTGSPIPRGADAVVMQEDAEIAEAGMVRVLDTVKPGENIRLRGEDVKTGAVLGEAGEELTAGRMSLLAAAGLAQASVGRRPVMGLLATGSELMEAGQPLGAGKIYESNRAGLAALATQAGAVPRIFPLVPDTLADTSAALAKAFSECDLVVTAGGVSVGEMDFVKSAFEQLGGSLEFWKIAIRPGRPFVFGRWQGKCLLGLPGNPVSAFVTFQLLVRPLLARWQGAKATQGLRHTASLSEALVNRSDYRHFMRVVVDDAGNARSAGTQASHIMAALAAADGLVEVPPKTTLAAGTSVLVRRW